MGSPIDTSFLKIHRIDVPNRRVKRIIADIHKKGLARVPAKRAKRRGRSSNYPPPINEYMTNPLLLTVNPQQTVSNPNVSIPFKKGQKISIERFEKWLYENCPDEWIKGYEKVKKQYKKFHLGTMPVQVTMDVLPIGGSTILPPEFLYSAGESPAETYTTDKRSGKAPHSYVHEYKDKPEMLVGGQMGDQFILKPLRGRARIDDWMRD